MLRLILNDFCVLFMQKIIQPGAITAQVSISSVIEGAVTIQVRISVLIVTVLMKFKVYYNLDLKYDAR
jgi:hypothetical protein